MPPGSGTAAARHVLASGRWGVGSISTRPVPNGSSATISTSCCWSPSLLVRNHQPPRWTGSPLLGSPITPRRAARIGSRPGSSSSHARVSAACAASHWMTSGSSVSSSQR